MRLDVNQAAVIRVRLKGDSTERRGGIGSPFFCSGVLMAHQDSGSLSRLECPQCQWRRYLSGATPAEKHCPECGGELSSVSLDQGERQRSIPWTPLLVAGTLVATVVVVAVAWHRSQEAKEQATRDASEQALVAERKQQREVARQQFTTLNSQTRALLASETEKSERIEADLREKADQDAYDRTLDSRYIDGPTLPEKLANAKAMIDGLRKQSARLSEKDIDAARECLKEVHRWVNGLRDVEIEATENSREKLRRLGVRFGKARAPNAEPLGRQAFRDRIELERSYQVWLGAKRDEMRTLNAKVNPLNAN